MACKNYVFSVLVSLISIFLRPPSTLSKHNYAGFTGFENFFFLTIVRGAFENEVFCSSFIQISEIP